MPRLTIFLFSLIAFTSVAKGQFGYLTGTPSSTATLVSEKKTIAPGQTFSVALQLAHPAEWHSYYQNSGGVELAPAIEWKLPEGFAAGPIQWPVPVVKDGFFGKSFVYLGSPVFIVDLTAPASLKLGETVTLTADAQWQICKDSCINEKKSLTLTLVVSSVAENDPTTAELFRKARASQPTKPASWKFSATSAADEVQLRIEPDSAFQDAPTDFIPNQNFLLPASAGGKITRDGNAWRVSLKRATKDALDQPIAQGKSFSGILTGAKPIEVPETMIGSMPAQSLSFLKFLPILGGMLLGGLDRKSVV